jgi:hypothetical protein
MKKLVFIVVIILITASCSNTLQIADTELENKYVPFIKDNVTTRDDIILKLGEPSWTFENGRIFTYRLWLDKSGIRPLVVDKRGSDSTLAYASIATPRQYSLVLIFNANSTLDKHSLVRINP